MLFKIRSFTNEDLSNLVNLLNEARRGSYEFFPYTEEGLRNWISERRLRILIVVENGKVLGSVAYSDGQWGEEIRWLTVLGSPNQRRIEDELAKEVEMYVKGTTVFTVVDEGNPKIGEWIERGYRLEGGLYQMIAQLDGVKPLPKPPEGVILCSLKHDEEKEFVEAVNAGFGWERLKMGIIQRWKTENPPFDEEWVHLAKCNGRIVSVVASRPDTNYNNVYGGRRGYLGPATTLAEYRNKHLASILTVRAMNFLFEKGMDSVALHTSEQNVPSTTLLQRLGFKIGHHWKFLRKNLSQTEQ